MKARIVYTLMLLSTFSINALEEESKFEVEIINLEGQVLLHKSTIGNVLKMDVNDINSGIYVLRILSDNGIYNKKIILKG
jgi:hypothetical protein